MILNDFQKRFQKKQQMSPVSAGLVGVVAGAALGSIAAYALKDEATRQKLTDTVTKVKSQALSAYDTFKRDYISTDKSQNGTKAIEDTPTSKKNKTIFS